MFPVTKAHVQRRKLIKRLPSHLTTTFSRLSIPFASMLWRNVCCKDLQNSIEPLGISSLCLIRRRILFITFFRILLLMLFTAVYNFYYPRKS